MKKLLHCLILLLGFTSPLFPQSKNSPDTNKYRLNLPDYWKPGNKVWRILDDKLPTVAPELVGKQLCGDDCKAKYTIEFEMSEPTILDYYSNHLTTNTQVETWEFVTLYSFTANLYLFDENKVLTRFILVDTNEIWRKINRAQLPAYVPKPPQKIYSVRQTWNNNPSDPARQYVLFNSQNNSGMAGMSPYTYINENKAKLSPTQWDMLGIIDEKIRSW
jgi:hypothetical protein